MIKSPRWLRPNSVTVINVLPEYQREEQTTRTEVGLVKAEVATSSQLTVTGREFVNSLLVIMDVNDYKSDKAYVRPENLKDPTTEFTLKIGDRIEFEGREWEVTGVKDVAGPRSPQFIEVTGE